MAIGRVNRTPLRDVWNDEARDFTPWLVDNIDVLGEALDLSFVSVQREQRAGDFSVDIAAEEEGGGKFIIENQLGKSDHDHLGKVVTYLAYLEVSAAVWIVGEPRPEHVTAISKLNEGIADFYLVKLEAVSIEESPPAALLTLIAGPSIQAKEKGKRQREESAQQEACREFWTELLNYAKTRTKLHSISPGPWTYVSTKIRGEIALNYYVRKNKTIIGIEIDQGPGSDDKNRHVFNRLKSKQELVEQEFADSLTWQDHENTRLCRIFHDIAGGGWADRDKWNAIHERMVDAMIRFHDALEPHLDFATTENALSSED